SPAGAQAGVTLGVGRIDDSDTTWVNGVEVGSTHMQYNLARAYAVPASALRAGSNTVAVRVTDTGGGGGIHGPAQEVFVQPAGAAPRALAGSWKFRPAQVTALVLDDNKNQRPTLLYNAMIAPLQPLPLRGVIWYQGDTSPWAVLRESQTATLSLPATAEAVAIDIGDVADIHPKNKQDVGKR